MRFVLDASAVLALLQAESGAERVRAVIRQAALSSVNLTEVVTKLTASGVPADELPAILGEIEVSVHAHDEDLAIAAGVMHTTTRSRGLSLGDRACLALARRLSAMALTADRAWGEIDISVPIEVIR